MSSVLDQLLADFPETQPSNRAQIKKRDPTVSFDPIEVHGVDHQTFSTWIRSKEQARLAIRDKLGSHKLSLENCIKLYTEHNIKIDDFVSINFLTSDVFPYREYDRDLIDGWTGKMNQDEYLELMSNIKTKGIMQPGVLDIVNLNKGMYEIYLGEGNHRLKIATETGIETFPIRFSYRFG